MKFVRNHWPVLVAVIVLWVVLAALTRSILVRNDGHLIYAQDDPYIHMAVAKNLALHGVWGTTRYGFTSATSSLLWPLMLALVYKVIGPNEITPFILNVLIATCFLCVLYVLWRKSSVSQTVIAVGLTAAVLLVPLGPLALCAQEHILHCLLTVAVVYAASRLLCAKESRAHWDRLSTWLLFLVPLLTMTRYESFFLVAVACYLFALRGRKWYGFFLGAAAAGPAVVYGVISKHMGWAYLPNPVLVKGNTNFASPKGLLLTLAYLERQLMKDPLMSLMLAASAVAFYLLYARGRDIWREETLAVGILVPLVLMQVGLARTGCFFRYEAYIIALGVFAFVLFLRQYHITHTELMASHTGVSRRAILVCVFVLAALPLLDRMFWAHWQTPFASSEIYRQQYQMARFLGEYYDEQPVAANDIGAIDYLTECKCLDLYGLADIRVERAMKAIRYDSAAISELAKADGVKVAIVYDSWFTAWGGVPRDWIRVGQWTIATNMVCGSRTVSIYAVDPSEVGNLEQYLADFATQLPDGVTQSGAYTELM